jgi:hypothetical protein
LFYVAAAGDRRCAMWLGRRWRMARANERRALPCGWATPLLQFIRVDLKYTLHTGYGCMSRKYTLLFFVGSR